jgi:hypothetical protein
LPSRWKAFGPPANLHRVFPPRLIHVGTLVPPPLPIGFRRAANIRIVRLPTLHGCATSAHRRDIANSPSGRTMAISCSGESSDYLSLESPPAISCSCERH